MCFYLFASFTSVPLHFLVFLSLVESNPSRQSSCKRLLINLVAHHFIMKLMVLLIRGAVSFILIDIIVYRKMRNHFLLSFVSSNASYMIIHCFMGLHMSFHATLHYSIFISLRLMPPAFAGLEIASSMARSTTKSSSSNNSTILSIASSMARSTTKSNSNSSNNQQQQ